MSTLDQILLALGGYAVLCMVAMLVIAHRTRELPGGHVFEKCKAPGCSKRPLLYERICEDCKQERTLSWAAPRQDSSHTVHPVE